MEWLLLSALAVLLITYLYGRTQIRWLHEPFVAGPQKPTGLQAAEDVDLQDFRAGNPLSDMLPEQQGLTDYGAAEVAAIDRSRQLELGGQYVQRTNNYRRDYPDNWSAPLSDFVGSIYKPKDGVGLTVPCAGQC